MEGIVWVWFNGADRPLDVCFGVAEEVGDALMLRDKGGALLGRLALADVQHWCVQGPPLKGEWLSPAE